MELQQKKVPEFIFPRSILLLDGDVKNERNFKRLKDKRNILVLPGSESPEFMLIEFLKNLKDDDPLWSKTREGFSKQFCFKEHHRLLHNKRSDFKGGEYRVVSKEWFRWLKNHLNSDINKLIDALYDKKKEEQQTFISDIETILKNFDAIL